MSICQLQKARNSFFINSFFLIFLMGCANQAVVLNKEARQIIPNWHKLPPRFSNLDEKDRPVVHPFFDVNPLISQMSDQEEKNLFIRYIVTTPEGSKSQYGMDLYSGKLYRQRLYCSQDDIWDNYRADLMTPNFTQGIVPRVLDENGKPMQIIIIGDKNIIEPFKHEPKYFDEVKVIGSVILENCESYPCDQAYKWKPSQILFGINARESSVLGKNSFTKLKLQTDWNYAKGMLTNMHGYHRLGGKTFPAYRISKELNMKDTLAYFKKTATVFDDKKMSEMQIFRESCMKLYDEMWAEVQKIRNIKTGQADQFLSYFQKFYKTKSEEYYQCQKWVRPGTIVDDPQRLWYFSYIHAFTLLEKNGFFYNCSDNSWAYNPMVDDKKRYIDQNVELVRCKAKNFAQSFDRAINGMSLMRNQINRSFRFIEYDTRTGGSHQKIYGWVEYPIQNYGCKDEAKKPSQVPIDIFPQDVVWETFRLEEPGVIR